MRDYPTGYGICKCGDAVILVPGAMGCRWHHTDKTRIWRRCDYGHARPEVLLTCTS